MFALILAVSVCFGMLTYFMQRRRELGFWERRNRNKNAPPEYDDRDKVMFLPGFFVSLFVTAIIMTCVVQATADDVRVTWNIENLGDNVGAEGHFFLGGGTVDTEAVYFYYTEDDGSYTLHHIDADITDIRYTDGTPRLERYCQDLNTGPDWLFWPITDRPEGDWIECDEYDHATFYVPEGSVKSNYNLDAS